jgi:hypothetical protein
MKRHAMGAVLAILLAGSTVLIGTPGSAATARTDFGSQMNPGTQLNPGDRLTSPNGLNTLEMQHDGNLVEYIPGHVAVWSSGTSVPRSIFRAQRDGNFVVIAPGNQPQWDTGTGGQPGTVIQIQNDRNVVAYAPGHIAVWTNHTAGG